MDGPHLPLQLLLLVLTVTPEFDARSATTVTAHEANVSLEATPNATALDHEVKMQKPMTIDQGYSHLTEICWSSFVHQMSNLSEANWCDWKDVSRPYTELRNCMEAYADILHYGYPNALAENYTILSHRLYFLNCTMKPPLLDPPENVLLPLIITPICLIPFLVTLVVLKSKDGEMQS